MTIAIQYTDDGFSLANQGDRAEWSCKLDVKAESDHETRLRQLFGNARPTTDYLYNFGRERSLACVIFNSTSNPFRFSISACCA